jgi:hypothetical protein
VLLRPEPEGDGVHAVPRVPRRKPLSLKHVAEVATASGALDLDAFPIRVRETPDGARNLLVKGRPTAVGVELVLRTIERRPAPLAFVRSLLEVALVLPRERRLGAFANDHPFLGPGEGAQNRGSFVGHAPPSGEPY